MKNYRQINFFIEFIAAGIIAFQSMFIYLTNSFSAAIITCIVSLFVYMVLTITMYYSSSPKTVLREPENPELFGRKSEPQEKEKILFLKTGILFFGLFKLLILFIPVFTFLSEVFLPAASIFLNIAVIIVIIFLAIIMITLGMQNFLFANGYLDMNFKRTLLTTVFYYNQDDKRPMVNKQFGYGTTINFASRDGRLVLYIVLAVPLTIVTVLLIVLKYAGC